MTTTRRRLPLTVRITVTFALGGLLVSAAVAISSYFLTYRFLTHQQMHDAQRQGYLGAAIVRNELMSGRTVPQVLDALISNSLTSPSQAVVFSDGSWYSSSLLPSRDSLPTALKTIALRGQPATMWATINKAPQIVTAIPLPAVNSVYFGVVDESSLARTLSTLRAILLAASAATTAAAAALGWRASRRLTRPLRAVTAAAAQIGAGRLDTHLDEEADPDLSRLVVSFNAMVDSLSERIDRDARFAADVSHELRSPLTTLRTSVGVLEGRRNELTERGQSALDLMTGELTRFERLVEDLLEMSRLDAEQQPPVSEPIRICELVLNLVQQPEYAGTAINVDSRAVDCVVMADKVRLVQAVRNILDNARNHAGGITEVLIRHPDDNVTITVDDSGPGVPPADQDRIFERFARGRSASRRGSGGGSGLGLALVREHVHRHGGEVRVELRPTGGSRFIIELPVAQP